MMEVLIILVNLELIEYKAYRIKTLGTPNLTWEVAKKYDIGVDFSVLNGKFTGACRLFCG